MKSLAVYCGSGLGDDPRYAEQARVLGELLAARDIELVFGGGRVGLMGVIADAVLNAGGRAVGVMPQRLIDKEVGHTGLSELLVVETMHQRKALMMERADGFVAMPGGAGTLEEIFEAWTWQQIGYHDKPCALLDVAGFWQGLLAALGAMADHGFVRRPYLDSLVVAEGADVLLDRLATWAPPSDGWISLG